MSNLDVLVAMGTDAANVAVGTETLSAAALRPGAPAAVLPAAPADASAVVWAAFGACFVLLQ